MKKSLSLIVIFLLCFQQMAVAEETQDEMYYKRQIQNQRILYSNMGLVNAMQKKNIPVVEAFMKAGFNPNDIYCGTPFLFYAISFESPEAVNILLDAGADPEVTVPALLVSAKSTNALLYAISKKNSLIVKNLIEHNVDVNKTYNGKYPLNFAIKKKQTKIVEMLLNAGALPNNDTKKLINKSKDEYLKSLF